MAGIKIGLKKKAKQNGCAEHRLNASRIGIVSVAVWLGGCVCCFWETKRCLGDAFKTVARSPAALRNYTHIF